MNAVQAVLLLGAWVVFAAPVGARTLLADAASPQAAIPATPAAGAMPMGLAQVAAVGDLGKCIDSAATYHRVNAWVLAAILRRESRLKATTVIRNTNGSVDVGIGGVNSVHFQEIGRHGIAPADLLNPCVGTFVAAWLLSKQVRRHGFTWMAIGAYHSSTPAHNGRYQIAIWNELVDMGALPGQSKLAVPR